MLAFSQSLSKLSGLSLDIYTGPTIDDFKEYQEHEILNEEILWKNMTDDEKVKKFVNFLHGIDSVNNKLMIIDGYIFPKKYY